MANARLSFADHLHDAIDMALLPEVRTTNKSSVVTSRNVLDAVAPDGVEWVSLVIVWRQQTTRHSTLLPPPPPPPPPPRAFWNNVLFAEQNFLPVSMKLTTATALLAMVAAGAARKDNPDKRTFAVLRFTNKQLTKGRLDPIVSPGKPSSHVHTVLGGSGFGLSSTGKDLMASNCSTALVKGDNSNYWFPSLYFKDPKTGKLEDVEMFYANVYYFFDASNDDIKAFPVGLSIVVGDTNLRTPPKDGASSNLDPSKGPVNPVKWTCPRSNLNQPAYPAGSDGTKAGIPDPHNKGEGVGFPDVNCDGYASPLRGDIHFPSCYNPAKGLTNFKENMVFPSDSGNGRLDCPKGHIHVPHLFLEVYWNTPLFKDRWTPGRGEQPFVLANGDATGYSNHADFMAAWDEELLQGIIDHCDKGSAGMDRCEQLKYGLNKGECTIESPVDETINGVLSVLPGKNPITGWQYGGNPGSGGDKNTPPSVSQRSAGPTNTKPVDGGDNEGTQPPMSKPTAPKTKSKTKSKTKEAEPVPTSDAGSSPVGLPTGPSSHTTTRTVRHTVTMTAARPGSTHHQPEHNSTRTVAGFQFAGCFTDADERVLTGVVRADLGAISNEKCVSHCKGAGFALAGTEYGGQCYCGNDLIGSKRIDDSACNMACEGDQADLCGGSWALSVYSKDGEASLKGASPRRHAHEHVQRHRNKRHYR
ncbi:hypothetical protein E4U41_003538 [Claviceps citrina]|nr:hypothetical protein E4U41_003538 [Claviceps citrina]